MRAKEKRSFSSSFLSGRGIKLDLFYGPTRSQPMISLGSKRLSDVINTNIHYIKTGSVFVWARRVSKNQRLMIIFSSSSSSSPSLAFYRMEGADRDIIYLLCERCSGIWKCSRIFYILVLSLSLLFPFYLNKRRRKEASFSFSFSYSLISFPSLSFFCASEQSREGWESVRLGMVWQRNKCHGR